VVQICNAFTLMLPRESALNSYMEVVEATPTNLILLNRARIHVSEVAPMIGKLEITLMIIQKPVKDTSMRNGAPRKVPLDPDGRTIGEVLQIMLMPMEILRWCVLNADAKDDARAGPRVSGFMDATKANVSVNAARGFTNTMLICHGVTPGVKMGILSLARNTKIAQNR